MYNFSALAKPIPYEVGDAVLLALEKNVWVVVTEKSPDVKNGEAGGYGYDQDNPKRKRWFYDLDVLEVNTSKGK